MRFTLTVTIAMDESKFLLLFFRGTTGGSIERSLSYISSAGIIGFVQSRTWKDNRTMTIWYKSVIKLYIPGYNSSTCLLLDDFNFHHSKNFT